MADALFDFFPEEVYPPAAEAIGGVALLGVAAVGNNILKRSEATN